VKPVAANMNMVNIGRAMRACVPVQRLPSVTSKEEVSRDTTVHCGRLRVGDKPVHIIDKSDVGERLARLNQAGISVETVEQSGPNHCSALEKLPVVRRRKTVFLPGYLTIVAG